MKRVFLLLYMISSVLIGSHAFAGDKVEIDADGQFGYAERLYEGKEYFLAIGEYRRFIHFFPEDARVEEAQYKTGMSWFQGGDFKNALKVFLTFTENRPGTPFFNASHFMAARCYEVLNDGKSAMIYLNNLSKLTDEESIRDRASWQSGMIYLDMAMWDSALDSFSAATEEPGTEASVLYKEIAGAIEQKENINRKSPGLAGALAVVPGGGYLYLNRYRDAFVSFVINGGLILAAAESFEDDNYALGGLLTFVGLGFYAGNIYGSIGSAHKYNRNEESKFIRSLKRKIGPMSSFNIHGGTIKQGFGLFMSCRF